MQITWHGLACFRLQADGAVCITDPIFTGSGLRGPRLNAASITLSDRTTVGKLGSLGDPAPRIIAGPGEYEAGGILVEGITLSAEGHHTAYRIIADGINVIVVGMLPKLPSPEAAESLAGGDILLLPVGGGPVITAAEAAKLVGWLEPRIVIPCCYKIPGLEIKLDPLDKFCKEMGICPKETLPKLKVSRKDLPADEMKVMVLEKS
ncbi:MAG: MBL fold metallo-hydrolase [Patescibacteria group bacterium]|nr:MBL fold metallo-hydrolase [Patescibacteria group bacterium]